jgi:RND family efflux transporter MFP subunit
MKLLPHLFVPGLLVLLGGCDAPPGSTQRAPESGKEEPRPAGRSSFVASGRTQCVPARKGTIAPAAQHPVIEVLVAPGDRVKKDQVLVKMDDDEPRADVRNKKAVLERARVAAEEARHYLAAAEKAHAKGAMPEINYLAARAAASKTEHDEQAAKAALEGAEAELEHYTVTAPVDGVVSWLDVHVGMVSRPGTTVWGEILDLSEIDARCELAPDQADRVAVGQAAEVRANGKMEAAAAGKVVFVGLAADRASGLVPVVVRVPNPKGALRCEVPVQVRFTEALAGGDAR